MPTRLPHWQVMERFDPGLLDKLEPWREQLLTEGVLPRRDKELIMSAMCGVVRFLPGFTIHAERALHHGANDYALMSLSPSGPPDYPRAEPDSAGIPPTVPPDVLIAPYNDLDAVSA